MAWAVYTTDGVLAFKPAGESNPPLTEEQAEASAAERNARAEQMGIKARYEAREVGG